MADPFQPRTYGDAIADVYDEWADDRSDAVTDEAVDFLARLAGDRGTALELGIGTGRIALPLAARGIAVTGVEASPRMVEQLRAKQGGAALPVVVADMAEVPVSGSFDLVYVVASTLYCLTDQRTQVRCLSAPRRGCGPVAGWSSRRSCRTRPASTGANVSRPARWTPARYGSTWPTTTR
jgi:SAM-dependent methyltransferase